MVELIGMLSHLNPVKVLVIGDLMLDTYTTGKVKRISPEAPVSVLHVQKEESRPGGAGNVVLNLISLGAQVSAIGRVGNDRAGKQLIDALNLEGVETSAIFLQENFQTPVKNRLIADAQQVLRVDTESYAPIPESLEQAVVKILPSLLDQVQIVAISDYGKGFLSPSLLMTVIEMSRAKQIPVIVDPKGDDFSRYEGATVIKPNLSEAYAAAKLPASASLERVSQAIFSQCQVDMLLITRSEEGMSLFHRNGENFHFPVRLKEVKDVTGAGDTVLATISVALANKLDLKYAAQLANIAAGMAIERLGCARIKLSELAERLLEFDVENKIFNEQHLFALKQTLAGKKYSVLGLESTQGMTTALFQSIRKLATQDVANPLIIYVRDEDPDAEFVSLLASLVEVDFIVLKCDSLKHLCEIIHPHQIHVMKKDALIRLDHPLALLAQV